MSHPFSAPFEVAGQPALFSQAQATIACSTCGTPIQPNPANRCVNCIRTQFDITEGIAKQLSVHMCRMCGRYLVPPGTWLFVQPESRELMAYLLRRIKGLNRVKLIDAQFVWTEPHSRRLRIKLIVQQEVLPQTVLEQEFLVEFIQAVTVCDACQRLETPHTWQAVAQVRQKVAHKKTFFHIEQLILAHNAHTKVIRIHEEADGLDFYFAQKSHCSKFVDFLQLFAPVRWKASTKLISYDEQNAWATNNYTFLVELPPVCRHDLVVLPRGELAHALGSRVGICTKISSQIHLLDPRTLTTIAVTRDAYWRAPFVSLLPVTQTTLFTVLQVEPVPLASAGGGPRSKHSDNTMRQNNYQLVDVEVARMSDFGRNDITFLTRTHLGAVLQPGDSVLGYDLSKQNFNLSDVPDDLHAEFPEILLVRKSFPYARRRSRHRAWRMQRLAIEQRGELSWRGNIEETRAREMEQYMREVEEDPELRRGLQLFPGNEAAIPGAEGVGSGELEDGEPEPDFPTISPNELVDEMQALAQAVALAGPDGEQDQEQGHEQDTEMVD